MRRLAALALATSLTTACAAHRPVRPARLADLVFADAGRAQHLPAGRPLVLVVFATWAENVAQQVRALDALRVRLGGDGPEFRAIAIDEDPRFVDAFVREVEPGFPVLRDPGARATGDMLALERVPTILLVDGGGSVVGRLQGSRSTPRELEALLVRLERAGPGGR